MNTGKKEICFKEMTCRREGCKNRFVPRVDWRKFCSSECRLIAWAEKRLKEREDEK